MLIATFQAARSSSPPMSSPRSAAAVLFYCRQKPEPFSQAMLTGLPP
jgi:hypothetical protein